MTHKHVLSPKFGPLVWIADRCLEEPPCLGDVAEVGWRWCVFLPLGAAANRRIVEVIGKAEEPEELKQFPLLRAPHNLAGWRGGEGRVGDCEQVSLVTVRRGGGGDAHVDDGDGWY